MPKARDLFGPKKVVQNTNLEENFNDIESVRNLRAKVELKKRLIPNINFSSASSFAKFGSAELYYRSAMENISNQYPYDGSEYEKVQFLNSSSYIDLYIFENIYPRQNGHIVFSSDGWGTQASTAGGYGRPATPEYITIRGTMNTASGGMIGKPLSDTFDLSNKYDEDPYDTLGLTDLGRNGTRTDNFLMDFNRGVTVEFWMNKAEFIPSLTEKEVIFDLWNGETSGSDSYGRVTLYVSASADGSDPFRLNLFSGSSGQRDIVLNTSQTTGTLADGNWHHYAVSIKNPTSGNDRIRVYLDGELKSTFTSSFNLGDVTGGIKARIGALLTAPSGTTAVATAGKLSASLDEFRYWKTERSVENVAKYYRTNIYGGVNTDIANTELGAYYKFNEGISNIDTLDSVVLDYSGRISNGKWTGYPGSGARSTSSAIVLAGVAPQEFKDPVIYKNHPDYISTLNALVASGSLHDSQNSSMLFNTFPNFVIDEDVDNNLKQTVQIVANTFDELYLQIQEINKVKDISYGSKTSLEEDIDQKAYPDMDRVLESVGLDTKELFNNETLLEFARNRNDKKIFKNPLDLTDVRNQIYSNIYNNAVHLLKSKGTQKSVRNFLRTIGVSEQIVQLKGYSSNRKYTIEDRFENNLLPKKYISFDSGSLLNATIFQTASSGNPNARGQFYVTGTQNATGSFSSEVNVFFPRKKEVDEVGYYTTNFLTSSIFGIHLLDNTGSYNFNTPDSNFHLVALRPFEESRDAKFALRNAAGSILLTSSLYKEVYTGNEWTFAVSVFSDLEDWGTGVSGSSPKYFFSLSGYNTEGDFVKDNFTVSASVATAYAQRLLTKEKTYFAGADRTNFSGTVLTKTDVEIGHIRHYDNVILSQEAVEAHAKDRNIFGTSRATKNFSLFNAGAATGSYIPEVSTILFNVDFQTVTGSDSSGEFLAVDFASGSLSASQDIRNDYTAPYGAEFATQYEFKGIGFPASSTGFVDNKIIIGSDIQFPEQVNTSDLVKVLTSDDEVFNRDFSPETLYYSLEKSFAGAFSREIVDFIGNVTEFNNIIGEAGAFYRQDYGKLDNLRTLFFQRVRSVKDFNKFYDYYKWFDDSVFNFILQLVPETANLRTGMQDIIENHMLERDKVLNPYPLFRQVVEDTNTFGATLQGINDLDYNWKYGHAPVTDTTNQNNNAVWWQQRAERTGSVSSGDNSVDADIASIKIIKESRNIREYRKNFTPAGVSYFKPDSVNNQIMENVSVKIEQDKTVFGGLNVAARKDINLLRSIVSRFVDAADIRVRSDFVETLTINDDVELDDKRKRDFDIQSFDGDLGRKVSNFASGNVETLFPGNILSASYNSPSLAGYNNTAANNINIGNIHLDYGLANEIPMQGVFTEAHVGGLQYRHNDLNTSSATTERPEGFKIGYNATQQRVFLGPPQAANLAITTVDTDLPYAPWTRDEGAKRPINIRNIKYGTGSQVYGNYRYEYNLMQLNGRNTNNPDFVKAEGFGTGSLTSSFITGVADYTKPTRPARKQIIVNRFSSPGDPLTAGDNQGGVGLDYEAAELSPYSHMNYRNLVTRIPLNTIFLVNHAVTGGFSSDQNNSGTILYNPSNVTSSNYLGTSSVFGVGVPSFHKTQRAGRQVRWSYTGSDFLTGAAANSTTKTLYDNYYVVSSLPGSELRYAWITSSYESSYILGYQTADGEVSTSAGLISEIVFTSGSDRNSSLSFVGANLYVVTDGLRSAVPTIDTNTLTVTFPSTSSVLVNDFILNTNGPYGYSSFKQVRVGENRVNRYLKNNNLFAYPSTTERTVFDPFPISRTIIEETTLVTTQSVISCRYDPVEIRVTIDGRDHILNVENGNQKLYFSQDVINNGYDLIAGANDSAFDNMIGTLTEDDTFVINNIKYRETIWPSEENSYLEKVRERAGFQNNFWRDTQTNRSSKGGNTKPFGATDNNSFYARSAWDLDIFDEFETATFKTAGNSGTGKTSTPGANTSPSAFDTKPGILQNTTTYNKVRNNATGGPSFPGQPRLGGATNINVQPLLYRNHFLQDPRSTVSRHGMQIELSGGVPIQDLPNPPGSASNHVYSLLGSGFAKWEAGAQAGYFTSSNGVETFASKSSAPFDDSYDVYNLDVKTKRKDLSIIPEYISSDFIGLENIDVFSSSSFNENFSIKLSNPSRDAVRPLLRGLPQNSSQKDFFKIYSHSDFLKHFDEVRDGAADGGLEPGALTLRFRGIKKFLPYNGFYPAERSTEVAQKFFDVYRDTSITLPSGTAGTQFSDTNKYRPVLQTLFAPGLLYNAVKSGMAVDYPIFTGSYSETARVISPGLNENDSPAGSTIRYNAYRGIGSDFHKRIPFEALYKPSLLQGVIVDNEPTQMANLGPISNRLTNIVNIASNDNTYIDMVNNYLAESVNFFLDSGQTTRILSDRQANFNTVTPGKAYGMRIKMYRSADRARLNSGSYGNYPVPQIVEEDFKRPEIYIYINKGLLAGSEVGAIYPEFPCIADSADTNWRSNFSASFIFSGTTQGIWRVDGKSSFDASSEQDDTYSAAGNEFEFDTVAGPGQTRNWQSVAQNLVSVINLSPHYNATSFEAEIDYTAITSGSCAGTLPSTEEYSDFVVIKVESVTNEDGVTLHVSNSNTPANTDNGLDNFFFVSNQNLADIDEDITTQTDNAKARIGSGSFTGAGAANTYARPTVTMYSRPTAFGPPIVGMTGTNSPASVFSGTYDSANGYNLPYTPPYYDGEAWLDVVYVPPGTSISGATAADQEGFKPVITGDPNSSKQLFSFPDSDAATTFDRRQDGLFVKYWRFDKDAGENPGRGDGLPARDDRLNSNAMQISASIDAFEVVGEGDDARWSIQLKFETPVLNFGHLTSYSSVTQPNGELSASVPRGIWHQFGRIPKEDEGIYLKVEEIPVNWLNNHPSGVIGTGRDQTGVGATGAGNAYTIRPFGDDSIAVGVDTDISLADVCGFTSEPVKVGKLRKQLTVREAVVAIPFRNVNGEKELFSLVQDNEGARERIQDIIATVDDSTSPNALNSVGKQIQKMKRYNFPPYLDFIKYADKVEPYSAYIFEFEHTFDENDLSYIWQNLTPPSGQIIEEVEETVTHNLRTRELLGWYSEVFYRNEIPEDIQWMVFKVKQKAKTSYERDILGKTVSEAEGERFFGFNWPYDHFSLVEMGKLDVQVDMLSNEFIRQDISGINDQLQGTNQEGVFSADVASKAETARSQGGLTQSPAGTNQQTVIATQPDGTQTTVVVTSNPNSINQGGSR